MKTAIACAAFAVLISSAVIVLHRTRSVSIHGRHHVSDAEFMRIELDIHVLYNQEIALLTSIQNEGSK